MKKIAAYLFITILLFSCFENTKKPVLKNIDNNHLKLIQKDSTKNFDSYKDQVEKMTLVEAWYTPQIPLAHGPGEFWGLPGMILEVSANNTTMLCSEIMINSNKTITIEAPSKGKETTKKEYSQTIRTKMMDMRNNRMGRRRSR